MGKLVFSVIFYGPNYSELTRINYETIFTVSTFTSYTFCCFLFTPFYRSGSHWLSCRQSVHFLQDRPWFIHSVTYELLYFLHCSVCTFMYMSGAVQRFLPVSSTDQVTLPCELWSEGDPISLLVGIVLTLQSLQNPF